MHRNTTMCSFIRTDVTAVKLFEDIILAGIGSYVCSFDKKTSQLLWKIQALKGQKIYGLIPRSGDRLLVYGGKQFSIISTSRPTKDCKVSETLSCDDWLLAAIWINDDQVAVLTAHNVVQVWDINTKLLLENYSSTNNSILYSGLLAPLQNEVLVFAGTVFSQIIISTCKDDKPLHILEGHKGVIFSVVWSEQQELIVTTSDDRSVRIWSSDKKFSNPRRRQYWEKCEFTCTSVVYGHLARVLRSSITPICIVSVGEDSMICFWDFSGRLLRKAKSHRNACIWSVDSDDICVVTGGGDAGIELHPLSLAIEYGDHQILEVNEEFGLLKKLLYTARGNMVALSGTDDILYFDSSTCTWHNAYHLDHQSTYKLLSISSCKQIIAVADMCGNLDIFIEVCKGEAALQHVIKKKLECDKVLSMHWAANRHLVICSGSGEIIVIAANGADCEMLVNFELPVVKERWLTAAAINSSSKLYVLGDRCGNIHFYLYGQRQPIKTFRKAHGAYGPTSINFLNGSVITTGRDGTIKYYSVKSLHNNLTIKYLRKVNIPFEWVEKFLDNDQSFICGFQERDFVVYDVKQSQILVEIGCGGGHRTWDAYRYFERIDGNLVECIKLAYIKKSCLNTVTFQLDKVISKNVINASHTKEINCLKTFTPAVENIESKEFYFIAGGEDTTFRISRCILEKDSVEFHDRVIFKQLSSIRTISTLTLSENRLLTVSGGGRAQMCIRILHFIKNYNETTIEAEETIDYMIKGTDKERKGNSSWRSPSMNFDPETRIMDIDIVQHDEESFVVVVGCSDSLLRVYKFQYIPSGQSKFHLIGSIKYHKTCILKVKHFKFFNYQMVVSMSTVGEVVFWDLSKVINESEASDEIDINCTVPVFTTKTNKSGINSFALKVQDNNEILLATGGDDNAIHIISVSVKENDNLNSLYLKNSWISSQWHCAQITGLHFIDKDYLLSTSIDQRITLSLLSTSDSKMKCEFIAQYHSDISDIQGMDVICKTTDLAQVCVFGKGLEIITIPLPAR